MQDCSYYDTLISASLDGELTAEEQAALQKHLESCRECRDYQALLRTVSGALRETQVEPPEKLSKGILYKVELEASRKRFRFREWRWTAMAAVICLAVFGVVKLGGLGSGALRNEAADTAMTATGTSVAGMTAAADSYQYKGAVEYSAAGGGFGSGEEERFGVRGETADTAAEDIFADDRDGASAALYGEVPTEEMGALMAPSDLPGYDVYYSLGEDAHYYSVLILYGSLPEGITPDRSWVSLEAPQGQRRWELSLDAVLELELQAAFSEIYYDDLMADKGLVIVLEDVQ